jgi:large subunit ribosomal protein L28
MNRILSYFIPKFTLFTALYTDVQKIIENHPAIINKFHYFCRPKIKDMARVCELTGKRPIVGNKVSHSNIKTKRRFLPNLQTKRYFIAEEDKWVVMKLSSEAIRTINKNGLYATVKAMRAAGSKI